MIATISLTDFDRNLDKYLELRLTVFNHQPSGLKANHQDLTLFSRFHHQRELRAITGDSVLDFVTCLRQDRQNGTGAINRKIASVRSYVRLLRFQQVEGAALFPIESLPRARQPYTGPIAALEPGEVHALLECLDRNSVLGFRDFVLYSLLYRLGLRLGEALAIDLADLDWEKQLLHVHGKGRRERALPLVSDLPALLEKWVVLRTQLSGAQRLKALFLSKKGHRLAARTAQENFQKLVAACRPLSLNKVTPHSFRHAFASHAIDGDQDPIILKSLLGHARLESTMLYAHPSLATLRRAVNNHPASEILQDLIDHQIVPIRIQQCRRQT